jgi:hypothetical protein
MLSPMGRYEHQSSTSSNLSLRRSHSHLLLARHHHHQVRKPIIEQDEVDSYRSTSFESSDIDLTPVVENRKELTSDVNAESNTVDTVSLLNSNVLSDNFFDDGDEQMVILEEEKVDNEDNNSTIYRIGTSSSSNMFQDEPYIFEERFHSQCIDRTNKRSKQLEDEALQLFAELPFYINDSQRICNCPKGHGLVEFATYKLVSAKLEICRPICTTNLIYLNSSSTVTDAR